ncbi:MAG: hypothetical protein K2L10_03080 [Ruminococcus sp.]|nr:hypothetical protein [Ruminococcus sp.]
MTDFMEILYEKWLDGYETGKKTNKAYDVFCVGKDWDEENTKFNILDEAFAEESRESFKAGFNTAVQLLMGGGQV